MSEFGDRIEAALSCEWQTTDQIADAVDDGHHLNRRYLRSHVYHHLSRLVRDGKAQAERVGQARQWRLIR